jgi:hypothetical protein
VAEAERPADLAGWTYLGETDADVFGGLGPGRLYFRVEDPANPSEVIEITARRWRVGEPRPGPEPET